MSAFRDARSIQPVALAHQYRLNIVPRKKLPSKIQRTQKITQLPVSDTDDCAGYDDGYEFTKRSNIDLDEEEENDFYFRCDTPPVAKLNLSDSTMKVYEQACKKYKIVPLSCIKKTLSSSKLTCQSIKLTYNDCKCICFALLYNHNVENIEFVENEIGPGSIRLFAEIIQENASLSQVNFAHNNLTSDGAKVLCEAVKRQPSITFLDISGTGLTENDGEHVRAMIENNKYLEELRLGHNGLSDKGMIPISEALKTNKKLRLLDLKWNHIRLQGAMAIGEALACNTSLEIVDLAWNGLHKEGARSIANALSMNASLLELDLTCNRLTEECIASILSGLKKNTTLEKLHIGQNQISTRGALVILQCIEENKTSGLKLVDFGTLEVHDKFVNVYEEMKKSREIEIKYGHVWSTERKPLDEVDGEDEKALLNCNPLTVLMECVRIQNLRLIDFFKSLDVDKSNLICINELCDGMIKLGVPIRRQTLLRLLRRLDKDNNGKLDFGEMIAAQKIHRQYIRKIFAQGDVEFENTEVGKVSILLRKIMSTNYVMKKSDKDSRRQHVNTPERDTDDMNEN
ncbi:hypothetical protein ACF0H5_009203 [Mactra antiquata]